MQTRPDTLLRIVVQAPELKESLTRHVGINELAWHRGHRYSTLIVNFDTHRPLVLLPSREQHTLAAWFKKYPEIRDRGGIYALVARDGAYSALLDHGFLPGCFLGHPHPGTRPAVAPAHSSLHHCRRRDWLQNLEETSVLRLERDAHMAVYFGSYLKKPPLAMSRLKHHTDCDGITFCYRSVRSGDIVNTCSGTW